jgi:hypothetical protein
VSPGFTQGYMQAPEALKLTLPVSIRSFPSPTGILARLLTSEIPAAVMDSGSCRREQGARGCIPAQSLHEETELGDAFMDKVFALPALSSPQELPDAAQHILFDLTRNRHAGLYKRRVVWANGITTSRGTDDGKKEGHGSWAGKEAQGNRASWI